MCYNAQTRLDSTECEPTKRRIYRTSLILVFNFFILKNRIIFIITFCYIFLVNINRLKIIMNHLSLFSISLSLIPFNTIPLYSLNTIASHNPLPAFHYHICVCSFDYLFLKKIFIFDRFFLIFLLTDDQRLGIE